jgi:hypothetical protein
MRDSHLLHIRVHLHTVCVMDLFLNRHNSLVRKRLILEQEGQFFERTAVCLGIKQISVLLAPSHTVRIGGAKTYKQK